MIYLNKQFSKFRASEAWRDVLTNIKLINCVYRFVLLVYPCMDLNGVINVLEKG